MRSNPTMPTPVVTCPVHCKTWFQRIQLAGSSHKGQHGKVSVLGGNREFTGAPFYSAMSAMQVGADYGNVFCSPGASTVIKSYAPELIVHPCMLDLKDVTGTWVRTELIVHPYNYTLLAILQYTGIQTNCCLGLLKPHGSLAHARRRLVLLDTPCCFFLPVLAHML